jgi:hypothetical protein
LQSLCNRYAVALNSLANTEQSLCIRFAIAIETLLNL